MSRLAKWGLSLTEGIGAHAVETWNAYRRSDRVSQKKIRGSLSALRSRISGLVDDLARSPAHVMAELKIRNALSALDEAERMLPPTRSGRGRDWQMRMLFVQLAQSSKWKIDDVPVVAADLLHEARIEKGSYSSLLKRTRRLWDEFPSHKIRPKIVRIK